MARKENYQNAVRRYLLRQLSETEEQELEVRLLSDNDLFEELQIAEDELIDEYLDGTLSTIERGAVEQHLLSNSDGVRTLASAKTMHRFFALGGGPPPQTQRFAWLTAWIQKPPFSSRFAVAAAVVVLAVLGVAVWRYLIYQSQADMALVALNNAYRLQRPVEARITGFNYAPLETTRGPGTNAVDTNELNRAQLLLLQQVHDKPSAAAHHGLGRLFLTSKDFDRAVEQFQEALKEDPNNAQVYADLGATYLEKGKIEIDKGKSDQTSLEAGKGLEDLGRALENLNKALERNPNLLEALFNRALCEQRMMLNSKAEEDWREYLKKDSNSPWAEEARRNLKSLEAQRTRASESEEQLRKQFMDAFQVKNDEQAWVALSRTQRRAGNAIVEKLLDDYLNLRLTGQSVDARRVMQVIAYAGDVELKKVGDRYTADLAKVYSDDGSQRLQSLAAMRNQIKAANASYGKNEFDDAIRLFTFAESSFAKVGDIPEALFARTWVGYSSLRIPKTEESIQIFEELSSRFEEQHYKFLEAVTLTALGDAYSSLNEYSKTIDYANRGLDASRQVEDAANAIRCLSQRLSMHLILNDERRSLDSFLRAAELADTIPPDPRLVWPLYFDVALDFHLLQLPSSALAFAEQAMLLANAADVPLLRSRSWERLGVIYSRQGNATSAIDCGQRALTEAQNISSKVSRKNILAHSTLILGQLYATAGDTTKAIKYFDESIGFYDDLKLEAYSYRAHKGKLLGLISLRDDSSATLELETVIRLFESQRKRIVEESNRDKFFDNEQDTYDVAIDFAVSRANDYVKAFEYAEASRARSLYEIMETGAQPITGRDGPDLALAARTTALNAVEIQKQMPANTQLLEYAVLKNKVLMWVVTPSSINTAQAQVDAEHLEESVRRYVGLLSQRDNQASDSGRIQSEGHKLYETLIRPVEGFLDTNRQLCIVADKGLNFLPFAALLTSSGRYLVEDYQLEQSPSSTVFVRCSAIARKKAQSANEKLLSVGNPEFNRSKFADLSDLPSATREATELASFYKQPTVLTGATASRERVERGFASADVIHLATHAVADERSPLVSKLILASDAEPTGSIASDGSFEAFDIYELHLPSARLVVLSACQTGIEHSYKGEGAVGLARPFIAAGVPLVVASLWPVDSNDTAELMIGFHRYRKVNQLPTVPALRAAQLDMIHRQSSNSGNSFGWAAFTAIGGYATY